VGVAPTGVLEALVAAEKTPEVSGMAGTSTGKLSVPPK